MKLYTWAVVDIAEQLKLSKAAIERTHQKVSRSLASLEGIEETMKKVALILGEPGRKS